MADELKNASDMADIQSSENIYASVRGYIIHAQRQVHSAVHAAMVGLTGISGKPFMMPAVRVIAPPAAGRF